MINFTFNTKGLAEFQGDLKKMDRANDRATSSALNFAARGSRAAIQSDILDHYNLPSLRVRKGLSVEKSTLATFQAKIVGRAIEVWTWSTLALKTCGWDMECFSR